MDAITKSEYDDEVKDVAKLLAEYAQDNATDPQEQERIVLEDTPTEVAHHNWFSQTYYDMSLYGSILEHADPDIAWSDWETATDQPSPGKVVKALANEAMTNDVTERALERLSNRVQEGCYFIQEVWELFIDGEHQEKYVSYIEVVRHEHNQFKVHHYGRGNEKLTTTTLDHDDLAPVIGGEDPMDDPPV